MKKVFLLMLVLIVTIGMLFAGTIRVTKPASGETLVKWSPYTIQWTKSGAQDASVKIRLYNPAGTTKILDITNSTANDGRFSWPVPNSVANGNYIIRVKTIDNKVFDDSGVFTIKNISKTASSIIISRPNLSNVWYKGNKVNTITWSKKGPMNGSVKIRLYDQSGQSKILDITSSTPNDGDFGPWSIPKHISDSKYIIRVKTLDNKVWDDSDVFNIATAKNAKPYINILKPNGGVFKKNHNDIIYIKWEHGHIVGLISVVLRKVDSSWRKVIKDRLDPNTVYGLRWKISSDIKAGKYYIIVKGDTVEKRSAVFSILDVSNSNNIGRGEALRPNTVINDNTLQFQPQVSIQITADKPEIFYARPVNDPIMRDYLKIKVKYKNADKIYLINKKTGKKVPDSFYRPVFPDFEGIITHRIIQDYKYAFIAENKFGKAVKDLSFKIYPSGTLFFKNSGFSKEGFRYNEKVKFEYEYIFATRAVIVDDWSDWKLPLRIVQSDSMRKSGIFELNVKRPMKLTLVLESIYGLKKTNLRKYLEFTIFKENGYRKPEVVNFMAGRGYWDWDKNKMFVEWEAYSLKGIKIYYKGKLLKSEFGKEKYNGRIEQKTPGEIPSHTDFKMEVFYYKDNLKTTIKAVKWNKK